MKQTIWKFGLISGVISSGMMLATMPFMDKLGHGQWAYVFGYAAIVLSFLLVYFGIRSYRDTQGGGRITFAKAFGVGILITLISCVFYVVTWEIAYFNFLHGFMDNYGAHTLERMRAAGASAAAIQAKMDELAKMKQMYNNPVYNSAMTFLEPFPVGLLVTLISAAVLRRSGPAKAMAVDA